MHEFNCKDCGKTVEVHTVRCGDCIYKNRKELERLLSNFWGSGTMRRVEDGEVRDWDDNANALMGKILDAFKAVEEDRDKRKEERDTAKRALGQLLSDFRHLEQCDRFCGYVAKLRKAGGALAEAVGSYIPKGAALPIEQCHGVPSECEAEDCSERKICVSYADWMENEKGD